jgi:hypothetical protein
LAARQAVHALRWTHHALWGTLGARCPLFRNTPASRATRSFRVARSSDRGARHLLMRCCLFTCHGAGGGGCQRPGRQADGASPKCVSSGQQGAAAGGAWRLAGHIGGYHGRPARHTRPVQPCSSSGSPASADRGAVTRSSTPVAQAWVEWDRGGRDRTSQRRAACSRACACACLPPCRRASVRQGGHWAAHQAARSR